MIAEIRDADHGPVKRRCPRVPRAERSSVGKTRTDESRSSRKTKTDSLLRRTASAAEKMMFAWLTSGTSDKQRILARRTSDHDFYARPHYDEPPRDTRDRPHLRVPKQLIALATSD